VLRISYVIYSSTTDVVFCDKSANVKTIFLSRYRHSCLLVSIIYTACIIFFILNFFMKKSSSSIFWFFDRIWDKAIAMYNDIWKNINIFIEWKRKPRRASSHSNLDSSLQTLPKPQRPHTDSQLIKISTHSMIMFWVIGALIAYTWYIAYEWLHIIYIIITWLIISIAIESAIVFFSRWVTRWRAIAISYGLLLVFMSLWIVVFIPLMVEQWDILIKMLVEIFKKWQLIIQQQWLEWFVLILTRMPEFFQERLLTLIADSQIEWAVQQFLQQNMTNLLAFGRAYVPEVGNLILLFVEKFIWFLIDFSLVFVLAVLCSVEKPAVARFLASLWGKKHASYRQRKVELLYKKLGSWLKWQFILCIFIGVAVGICMMILSLFWLTIPNSTSIALLAWLTEFVPYVWPILWSVPAIIIATVSHGWIWMFVMLWVFLLVQQFENNILVPRVMNKALWVNPVVIFVSMLIWWVALWFLGILLAVPIAVITTLLLDDDFE